MNYKKIEEESKSQVTQTTINKSKQSIKYNQNIVYDENNKSVELSQNITKFQ